MSKLFSIDLKVGATAYIKADSPEAALEKVKALATIGIQFSDRRQEISEFADVPIYMTGEGFSPDLPELSLSPVMTIHGPWDGDEAHVEECDDLDD